MLDVLNGLGFGFQWSNRVIPLGREQADREIKRIEHRWYQKRKSLGAWMRLSEALALDRDDVDLEAGILRRSTARVASRAPER